MSQNWAVLIHIANVRKIEQVIRAYASITY